MAATLNPNMLSFRERVNKAFPGRNRVPAKEGTWGDKPHQTHGSAHNTGDAVDITHDPGSSGASGTAIAEMAIKDPNVKNVIFNRQIWTRSSGKWSPFVGKYKSGRAKDPHTDHVHIEFYARRAARGDPSPTTVRKKKKKKTKVAARRRPAAKRRKGKTAAAPKASAKGGKKIVQGEHSVVLGTGQRMAAHVETPHTGGGRIAKGSPTVFIGPRQLAFARIGDPTTDGYNVVTGKETVFVG